MKKAIYNDSKDQKHNNLLNSISQVQCIIRKVGVVRILIFSKKITIKMFHIVLRDFSYSRLKQIFTERLKQNKPIQSCWY